MTEPLSFFTYFEILRRSQALFTDIAAACAGLAEPSSTIVFSRPISSGPQVSGPSTPIFTPVQPLALWLTVTMVTVGISSSSYAKQVIALDQIPSGRIRAVTSSKDPVNHAIALQLGDGAPLIRSRAMRTANARVKPNPTPTPLAAMSIQSGSRPNMESP